MGLWHVRGGLTVETCAASHTGEVVLEARNHNKSLGSSNCLAPMLWRLKVSRALPATSTDDGTLIHTYTHIFPN
eukprot:22077-Amphidinium_carterae.1